MRILAFLSFIAVLVLMAGAAVKFVARRIW
jgi:hypothetical protein